MHMSNNLCRTNTCRIDQVQMEQLLDGQWMQGQWQGSRGFYSGTDWYRLDSTWPLLVANIRCSLFMIYRLVGGFNTFNPFWKTLVSWDFYLMSGRKKHVLNHQPVMIYHNIKSYITMFGQQKTHQTQSRTQKLSESGWPSVAMPPFHTVQYRSHVAR